MTNLTQLYECALSTHFLLKILLFFTLLNNIINYIKNTGEFMNKFFLVDARKFVMLSTYYAFKTEGVLCLDDADVKEFLKKYNMIYNTKTKLYNWRCRNL